MSTKRSLFAAVLVLGLLAVACGGKKDAGTTSSGSPAASAAASSDTLRLGYFPNVTHATAIVGVEKGFFAKHLGSTKLETKTFNAGGDAVTALFGNAIDATYVGPGPALNAYQKSSGSAIRIIAGATSGGAFLVVKPGITSADGLKGKTIATPQLGNTQDIAARAWLKSKGLSTDTQGGGDVHIAPQENSQTLDTFKQSKIDGAWVPEPWATRLIKEGGAHVLVDERDLWPNGRFVTTHLVVRKAYLDSNPEQVKELLEGDLEADAYIKDHEAEAKQAVNSGIEKITTKSLSADVLDAAWKNMTFTPDPVASSLQKGADEAISLGLLDKVDLTSPGIYDLAPLNALLKAEGREEVSGL